MQAALIIALFIESHICDKSFISYEILDKLIHLFMSLMIITKVGSDWQTLSSKPRCIYLFLKITHGNVHKKIVASIIASESNR